MNPKLASTLVTITTMAAAVLAVAAIASGNAYADDITIDNTPFASSKTRDEVRAEVMGQSEPLRIASSEWSMQLNYASQRGSAYTREQAIAEYIASRNEVNARNAEDSGSSYFAALPRSMGPQRHLGWFGALKAISVKPAPPSFKETPNPDWLNA